MDAVQNFYNMPNTYSPDPAIRRRKQLLASPSDSTGIMNPFDVIDSDNYGIFDKRAYQHDLQEAQYAAELQMMMYQNEYNSPTAQAQRQREAGINPDLAGVSGESAAGMQGNANPANITAEDPTSTMLGLVPTVMSLITGLSSGIFGVSQGVQQLEAGKLDNLRKSLGLIQPAGDMIGALNADSSVGGDGQMQFSALADVDTFLKKVPRRYRKTLGQYLTNYVGSPQYMSGIYDRLAGRNQSKGNYAKTEVDPTMSGDVTDIMETMRPLQEAEFEVAKIVLGNEKTKGEKMSAYWMNRDLGASAETENAQDAANKGQAEIMDVIRAGALKTVKQLEKAMDDGKWWASTALSALYAAMQGLVNTPSFSSSSNSHTGADKHGNPTESTSRSWNFGF